MKEDSHIKFKFRCRFQTIKWKLSHIGFCIGFYPPYITISLLVFYIDIGWLAIINPKNVIIPKIDDPVLEWWLK